VAGEFELLQTLKELFGDAETLGARQRAAKDAFSIMSHGVVNRVWDVVCRFAIDFETDKWKCGTVDSGEPLVTLRGMFMDMESSNEIFSDSMIITVHHITCC
jgi:hypothetical protein